MIWEKVCSVLADIRDSAKTEVWLQKKPQFDINKSAKSQGV